MHRATRSATRSAPPPAVDRVDPELAAYERDAEAYRYRRHAWEYRRRAATILGETGDPSAAMLGEAEELGERARVADDLAERAERVRAGSHLEALRRAAFRRYLLAGVQPDIELRGQSLGRDVAGGYLAAPVSVAEEIGHMVDELTPIRALARELPPVAWGSELAQPWADDDDLRAAWGAELTGPRASQMAYQGRIFRPAYRAYETAVSRALLAGPSGERAERFVLERLARRSAELLEAAYTTGDGVGEPLGLFTPSDDGVPVAQDIVSAGSGAVAWGDLVRALHHLRAEYSRSATWVMHRSTAAAIAALQDTAGAPIWEGGDELLGRPVVLSEYAPEYAAGAYALIVGDLAQYWYVDAAGIDIVRGDEQLAERNIVTFVGREMSDGAPVIGSAFCRLRIAA